MPKRTTGITTDSIKNFVLDAGAIYINYLTTGERLLGATRGGSTFTVETEVREMPIDGTRTAIVGAERITRVTATLTTNLLELTATNLSLVLAGSSITGFTPAGGTAATHDEIRRNRHIGDIDYISNIAIVAKMQGKNENFVGILYNALASGGVEIGTADEDEGVIEATFKAHILPADILDDGTFTEPWTIRVPKL